MRCAQKSFRPRRFIQQESASDLVLKVMRNLNFEVLRHVVEIETNPKGNERREKKTPLDTIARRFEL